MPPNLKAPPRGSIAASQNVGGDHEVLIRIQGPPWAAIRFSRTAVVGFMIRVKMFPGSS